MTACRFGLSVRGYTTKGGSQAKQGPSLRLPAAGRLGMTIIRAELINKMAGLYLGPVASRYLRNWCGRDRDIVVIRGQS
jgi:hypothetical protein